MITVFCRTNLDKWRGAEWPNKMVALHRVGDYVEGRQGDFRPKLKVVAVTHKICYSDSILGVLLPVGSPYIEVELHN